MAQFYTLEEAARVLGMSPEDLKQKAQHREVRAFMDSGSWQFRVADIDELARRRGLGSDPELSLSDLELEVPDASGSDEIDLSEFQLGTGKPDLASRTKDIAASGSGSSPGSESDSSSSEHDVQFDDLSLPAGPLSSSSSTIIGMKSGGKKPSDSDVRLVPEKPLKDASDSDVRLMSADSSAHLASDSDVTLVNDASESDMDALSYPGDKPPAARRVGSSQEVSASAFEAEPDSGSDFELQPSQDIASALEPESGSDFELTALDVSDEFEATPLAGPSDSDVTAAQPSASGINLARPSDSGINLQGVGGFDLSQADSIELAPLDDDEPARPAPKPKPKAAPVAKAPAQDPNSATVMPGVLPADPGATSMGMSEKDIFEDTDFSLEVDALDSDHDDRTVQIDRSSDFDLEESDSASEVFALDEDDVDQNAATAMGAAVAVEPESGEFEADDSGSGEMSSGWDVESDSSGAAAVAAPAAVAGPGRLVPAGPQAEWGGIWVGLLGFTTALIFVSMVFSIDLIRNLYEFQNNGPAAGLISQLAGMFK